MTKLRLGLIAFVLAMVGTWTAGQVVLHNSAAAQSPVLLAAKDKNTDQSQSPNTNTPNTDPTTTGNGNNNANNSQNNNGSQTGSCPQSYFFVIPTWYKYLDCTSDAGGLSPGANFNFPDDIPNVAIAIIDMLLSIAGMVAVFSIIASGVVYITAGGSVEKTASARARIWNSFIGLAVVFIAAAFIRYIGAKLGGS